MLFAHAYATQPQPLDFFDNSWVRANGFTVVMVIYASSKGPVQGLKGPQLWALSELSCQGS
jgi:hypothetical protein